MPVVRSIVLFAAVALMLCSPLSYAGVTYAPPSDGWTYIYTGNQASGGGCKPGMALDGTWNSQNNSSEWVSDGRGIGVGPKGGAEAVGGILTLEDAEANTSGTCNNKKIYFTHDMAGDGVADNAILDNGVTISFRARLTPQSSKSEIQMPNGAGIVSDGKGMFGVRQQSPGSLISFSLVNQVEDASPAMQFNFNASGLTFNRNNGEFPSGSAVNSSTTAGNNPILPLDPTVFHEFWITIQTNVFATNGTHTLHIYVDGSTNPSVFNVTAGNGNDQLTQNYLGMGLVSSSGTGAYDVDFFAYKPGLIEPVPTNLLPPPGSVRVIDGNGEVRLFWASVNGAETYYVKRATVSGGPYEIVSTNASPGYVDSGLENGTIYYYVIASVNSSGVGPESEVADAQPRTGPGNLAALGGEQQVELVWDPWEEANSYSIKRSTSLAGPFVLVASGITDSTYIDDSVQSGRHYFYLVTGRLSDGGESGASNLAEATTIPGVPVPFSVELFAARVARITWVSQEPEIKGFRLEQAIGNGSFQTISDLAGNVRSTFVDLQPGTLYSYRLRATNDSGFSPYTSVRSVQTPEFGINVNFTAQTLREPIPGYVNDFGNIYGQRTGGLVFGWNDDNTAHARERSAGNSPDKRYDTFNHTQKTSPLPAGSLWEIQVPPDFYHVRLVAGDPANYDSVFQFQIENVQTPPQAASPQRRWAEFSKTIYVADGKLTITHGPDAINNKINFIDIIRVPPAPPVIASQPQGATEYENRPFELNVTLSGGAEPFFFQWRRNGLPIADATNSHLIFPMLKSSDAGAYVVVITNFAGSVTSETANIVVLNDSAPPSLLSANSLDGYSVGLCFDEFIDPVTGSDNFNYTITLPDGAVFNAHSAALRSDGRTVLLVFDPSLSGIPVKGAYTIHAANIMDLKGNPNGGGTVEGGVEFLGWGDVGAPALPGTTFTCRSNLVDIAGSGSDVGGLADSMHFAFRPVAGDFDARIRVRDLAASSYLAKAVLMARENMDGGSRSISLGVYGPPPGLDQGEALVRPSTGGNTIPWHDNNYSPAAIPNAWLRLSRVGNTFRGYHSSDGVTWTQFAETTQSFPAQLLLGPGLSAHDNSMAHCQISDFQVLQQDFGDAPDPGFATSLGFGAAVHTVSPGLRLGTLIDGEPDGKPGPTATGDDVAGVNDDDGIVFVTAWMPGQEALVEVYASKRGILNAWIDFDVDGDWNDVWEHVFADRVLTGGKNVLTFLVPYSATLSTNVFARFRFTSAPGISFSGPAADGEVEDYRRSIVMATDISMSGSDSPDPVVVGSALHYTLQLRNEGPLTATGVTVVNTFPPGASFISANPSQGSCTVSNNVITCFLDTLDTLAVANVAITVRPGVAGMVVNSAEVQHDLPDLFPGDNVVRLETVVRAPAAPRILNLRYGNGKVNFSFFGEEEIHYFVEHKATLEQPQWTLLEEIVGNGTVIPFVHEDPSWPNGFYRIRIP